MQTELNTCITAWLSFNEEGMLICLESGKLCLEDLTTQPEINIQQVSSCAAGLLLDILSKLNADHIYFWS